MAEAAATKETQQTTTPDTEPNEMKNFLLTVTSAANALPVTHSVLARDYAEACHNVWLGLCQANPDLNVWMAVKSWCWAPSVDGSVIDPTSFENVSYDAYTARITDIIPRAEVFAH
jgi:hypothetical protein